jgi:hypothetical protein
MEETTSVILAAPSCAASFAFLLLFAVFFVAIEVDSVRFTASDV